MTTLQKIKYDALIAHWLDEKWVNACLTIWGNIDDTLQMLYEYWFKDWDEDISEFEDEE